MRKSNLAGLAEKVKTKSDNTWTFYKNRLVKFFRRFYPSQHNRYPELFFETKKALLEYGRENGKLLSFGCSTGEECFTLRKYFSDNVIIGADINRWNLRKARRANRDARIKFIYSTDENLKAEGKYAAIFCLSVLCRWEDTMDLEDCSDIYPFERFDKIVSSLAQQVAQNGLLVIYNSNFRFEEATAFSDFEIVSTPSVLNSGFVHKFDSDNKRLYADHQPCIYRKKVAGSI
jgi:hypothetical protein